MKIVAIEGLRGSGKSYLINQIKNRYNLWEHIFSKFPTEETINKLSKRKYDMEIEDDVIDYNLQFVMDFINFNRNFYTRPIEDRILIVDRYILSNLAHFKYDMYKLKGGAELWKGISRMLYIMYNDFYVEKPDFIIYLKTNKYIQPDTKFDTGKYKGAEHELEWFYDTELGNLKNILNIPFMTLEALKPETFENAETILKREGFI